MKQIRIKLSAICSAVLFTLAVSPGLVYADIQVDVVGNGEGTQNTVDVQNSQSTDSTQTNTASVQNNIIQDANTGDNTASGNGGEAVQITTGDVATQTQVDNNLNESFVDGCCAAHNLDVTVSGNGEGSENTVNANVTITTTVTVDQTATVYNNLYLAASTGNNRANHNEGEVRITTGDIHAGGQIINSVNQSLISVGPASTDLMIQVSQNGADSQNKININFFNDLSVVRNNIAQINNNVYALLNTGDNTALGNLNDVIIKTGDIDFAFNVANDPINTGGVVICCDDGEPVPPGTNPGDNPSTPPPPPSGGSQNGSTGNGSSNTSTGSVIASLSDILPATGASAFHFWIMAVVYLLTFLSGLYVRLRAGRSPTSFRGYRLLAY